MEYHVNYLAILVSAVLAFGIGALWYGPLFGKAWMKESGVTPDGERGNMLRIFGVSFLMTLVMALGMATLFHNVEDSKVTWVVGLTHGLYIGLAFIFTSLGINYQYEGKSFKLLAINAGYNIFFLMVMGAILGAWH